MSTKKIIIETGEILTSLGGLQETFARILAGKTAYHAGPFFDLPINAMPFENHNNRDIITACRTVWERIDPDMREPYTSGTLVVLGSAKGDIRAYEDILARNRPDYTIPPFLDRQVESVCESLGIFPAKTVVVSNACASGGIALETAKEYLDAGIFKRAVVIGFDCMSRFVASGFSALGALSDGQSRPFDPERDGLNLGEGAGIALLHARKENPQEIVVGGAGSSNDANHRTGPSRTGDGLFFAAKRACSNAGISPADIGAVKCHGTATPYNDAMESKALFSFFQQTCPPCVSIKGAIGHCSGGGSLIEVLIAAKALSNRIIPPTAGFRTLGVDEPIAISTEAQMFSLPSILCLSAGFGGVNSAIILRECT